MSLSCSCSMSDYDSYYDLTDPVYTANSSGLCHGCRKPISIGDTVSLVQNFEYDEDGEQVHSRIKGRICEPCWDMVENLRELGYCISEETGFVKDAYEEYLQILKDKEAWEAKKS